MKRPAFAAAVVLAALLAPATPGQDIIVKTDGTTLPRAGGREIQVVKETYSEIEYRMEGIANVLKIPAGEVEEIKYKRMPEAYESALLTYDEQEWGRALSEFEAAVERGKGYHWVEANARYRIALCHMRMGQYDEAVEAYRALLKAVPTTRFVPDAYLGIIRCTFSGQGAAGEETIVSTAGEFERLIKKNRLDEALEYDLRYELLRLRDLKGESIDADAERLAREAGGTNRAVANKARILIGINLLKRDPAKALEYFESVRKSAGERDYGIKAAAYCGIGESLFKGIREADPKVFTKARDYFLRAVVLADKYADRVEREVAVRAMYYAAKCFVLLQQKEGGTYNRVYARDLYREIVRAHPGSSWAKLAQEELNK
ncbi:MAG: tetratricopeptide repeat protein [Planctomycetes bacterium]|nr:tetratricopeptide repeat protein [Planctomycetota bacterium]